MVNGREKEGRVKATGDRDEKKGDGDGNGNRNGNGNVNKFHFDSCHWSIRGTVNGREKERRCSESNWRWGHKKGDGNGNGNGNRNGNGNVNKFHFDSCVEVYEALLMEEKKKGDAVKATGDGDRINK